MSKKNKIIQIREKPEETLAYIKSSISEIRPELQSNPYITEALKVLKVQGYRSAIGSIWNAVIDDLRNKIIHRSLSLFNKEMKDKIGREVKNYEDFQNLNNDDLLIEGAYKIGVIGWEAQKVLKHAKETRNIFYGHPRSSEPSLIKVFSMLDDCVKYVLKEEYPIQIIDIDDYIKTMESQQYDRNKISIENSVGDLPDIYKSELINKLFTAYIDLSCSTILRSNIEFCAPIIWNFINQENKQKISRRIDTTIASGNIVQINYSLQFMEIVGSLNILSIKARKYIVSPLLEKLENNLDNWEEENEIVSELSRYANIIPSDLLDKYVNSLTQTFVGRTGYSLQYSRTDFFANRAAAIIPELFKNFDDTAADSFLKSIRTNEILRDRISNPRKLRRLRTLANILLDRISTKYHDKKILGTLVDEGKERQFLKLLKQKST